MSSHVSIITPESLDEDGWVEVQHDLGTHDVMVQIRDPETWEFIPVTTWHYKNSVRLRIGHMDLTTHGTLEWRPAAWDRARVLIVAS